MSVVPVRRALLAAWDKAGLAELARGLTDLGVAVVSSGGTAAALAEAGVPVEAVADVTGWPEMLGGRVKTLHPRIHGGILADRSKPDHMAELAEHGIDPIDLVVVNLYPFRQTVASGAGWDEVIENIDIGGPAMVRAAAKNHAGVAVVTDPADYGAILDELRSQGGVTLDTRRRLAAKAFAHTAAYDAAVAGWFGRAPTDGELPSFVGLALEKAEDLRYGENPHQAGALYRADGSAGPLGGAAVLQGKAMSFNNWLDADAARGLAWALPRDGAAVVVVKHNNPCGAAIGPSQEEAYRLAVASDPVSAFGGVVATNAGVDEATARAIAEIFTEVVIAPGFSEAARQILAEKPNLRLVRAPAPARDRLDVRLLEGGALVQPADAVVEGRDSMEVAAGTREPTEEEWADLLLAWTVAAHVKSNAIVFVREGATVGVGAGQMSRVDSVELASKKAGDRAKGAAMGSDAFFPFRDGVDAAAAAGVSCLIQPGGSVRDDEVLAAANEHGMAVVLTGRRHFRH
jgi:phosphoribosylaminoimidazolecarboxamide formyltransferase/IMP cyclohydrolase